MTTWVKQTGEWMDCRLICAANAARYFGIHTSTPEDRPQWLRLVKLARCEHGAALTPELVDYMFGIQATPYWDPWDPFDLIAPSVVSIKDPKLGFHAVLVVGVKPSSVEVVGYEGSNEPKEFTYAELEKLLHVKGNPNRKAEFFTRR